jgi:hypothetical protein
MKLKSFGCSFVYGSDLSDQVDNDLPPFAHSNLTWPALIAKDQGLIYECYACPGAGNLKILCDIISQASLDESAVFVINWTWIDRFDFVNDAEQWTTLRPALVDDHVAMTYFKHLHSQIKDMITSVYAVNTAIDFLNERQIPFVMTYMDLLMLEHIDPDWHDPKYVSVMQNKIKNFLKDFDGKNFLDWSRHQGFAVSENWHPLEQAHRAAAEYMLPRIDAILRKA